MSYFNQKFYNKAYLLEFSQNGTPLEAVAFSLPPQSEDFEFPQRVAETKTFGGTVIEDYGNDNGKITLSGSTVNSEARIVSKGTGGKATRQNGEEEIFEIKTLIDKYGSKEYLGKTVKLYCLDSSNGKNYKTFEVVINSFSIKRSKENPLAYNYTLSCTSIQKADKYKNLGSFVERFRARLESICESIKSGVSFFETGLSYYRTGLGLISTLKEYTLKFEDALNAYVSVLTGFTEATANYITEYITETIALGDEIIKSAQRVTLGTGLTLYQSAANLNSAVADVVSYIVNFKQEDISTDLIQQYNSTTEDIKNTWTIVAKEIQDKANQALVLSMQQAMNMDYTVIPGDNGVDDQIVQTYGFTQKTAKDSDSWDSLARDYYGDTSYSSALALYNGANSSSDQIIAGSKIQIPIIDKKEANNETNLIYTSPEKKDNYGIDILIDNDGDLGFTTEDFKTIEGKDNLSQAIESRLRTAIGGRIRLNVYGIKSTVGGSSEAEAYLLASIEDTILDDPRIKNIESISYEGIGDNLQVTVVYTDINNGVQAFGGTF